jgi:hypothetical protein
VRLVLAGVALVSAFAIAAPAQAALPGVPDPAATVQQTVGQAQQQVDRTLTQTSTDVPQAKPVVDVVQAVDSTAKETVDQTVQKVAVAPTPRAQPPAQPATQPSRRTPSAPPVERKPSGGALGAVRRHADRHHPAAHAPVAAHDLQAASARPPAAEVGGRPVSLPPRTAPAPVAGGATALPFSSSSSAGGFSVPFLALLVLAALAMPRLLRRLDGPPAFVRPEPFLCALERPG